MKNSKIVKKEDNGTFDSKHGLLYKWKIEMENGDKGDCNTKDQEGKAYVIGEAIDYDFEPGEFPKIKKVYNKPNNSKGSNASFALSYAKDVYRDQYQNMSREEYFRLAGENLAWLKQNS